MSSRLGIIYFVRSGDCGLIKIGHTSKAIAWRMSNMQCGNPETLDLVATMPGDRALEKELHRLFAGDRECREWFRPTPSILWLIDELARGEDDLRHPEPVEGLRARIYAAGRAMVRRMKAARLTPWLMDGAAEIGTDTHLAAPLRINAQHKKQRAAGS